MFNWKQCICVTNRSLCEGDFLERIADIAACRPAAIILREKDLTPETYLHLARDVMRICHEAQVRCILHSHKDIAEKLACRSLHLPMALLREMTQAEREKFSVLGASCHSVEEAVEAQRLGCTYITAGHVFDTDCKAGLPGRGLAFLEAVCAAVEIPVYAIGGVSAENFDEILGAGAAGGCMMRALMRGEVDYEI